LFALFPVRSPTGASRFNEKSFYFQENEHGRDVECTFQNLEIHIPIPLVLGTKAVALLKQMASTPNTLLGIERKVMHPAEFDKIGIYSTV